MEADIVKIEFIQESDDNVLVIVEFSNGRDAWYGLVKPRYYGDAWVLQDEDGFVLGVFQSLEEAKKKIGIIMYEIYYK